SREPAAEADHDHKSPPRVNQHALCGPDDEPAHQEAACKIDDEGSVREHRSKQLGGETAQHITKICAYHGADGDEDEIHDGVLRRELVGVISPVGRLWRTPSPCRKVLPHRGRENDQTAERPTTSSVRPKTWPVFSACQPCRRSGPAWRSRWRPDRPPSARIYPARRAQGRWPSRP